MKAKLLQLASLLLLLLADGCAYVRVYDKERQAGFSSMMPAWPWQDSTRVIDRMNLSAKTNGFTASIRGMTEQEVTSTNAVNFVESVVSSAVSAAIKAAK